MTLLAILTMACGISSLLCLLVLHFVSPEFKPSWRMVSEYATGKHKWILTTFFFLWGVSSLLLACMLFSIANNTWATLGAIMVLVSGIGAIMGGLFDVKHKLHGLAFLFGVPFLPIGALISSIQLQNNSAWPNYQSIILISAHSTWISLIVMGISMAVMISGFKKAGIAMGPNEEPPTTVPDGVIALSGYANRLLVLCYVLWLIITANTYL